MKKTRIDPFDSESDERYDAFAEMRGQCPVHRVPGGQLFVVTQAGVEQGLKSVDRFVGSFGDAGNAAEEDTLLAAIAEPRHGRIRKIFNSALAYHHASRAEPFVRELAEGLLRETLKEAALKGEVELMTHFVRKIPSAVIAHVLGVPAADFEIFARWSDEVLKAQTVDDSVNKPLVTLHPEFAAYLEEQVRQRVESDDPPDDVITRLLETEIDGERLSQRAVLTQTMFLIIAGNETTRNLIGNIMARLASEPGLLGQLRRDRELVPRMIEESLRVDTPVQLLARSCTADVDIDGTPVAAGERVLFSVASANRDEKVYPDASEFRLDRPRPRDHVGFGAGPHVCPGAYLARMETQVALETVIEGIADIELAPGYVPDPNPVFWALGPQTLRVVLTPA